MRDEENDPVTSDEVANSCEEPLDLVRSERRCRLVENQNAWICLHRMDDFEYLALSEAELAHLSSGVDAGDPDALENLAGSAPRGSRADPAGSGDHAIEVEEIRRDVPVRDQAQLLVCGRDPRLAGERRGSERLVLAVDVDLAAVGSDRPREDLDQRRFTGAVFADERVDLAGMGNEVNAAESLDAAVGLGQSGKDERAAGSGEWERA